eukprot:NODE_328_length_10919_cov_0.472828.p2 type:complete len:243 gc:universal NODE_328_length_10919_cov_0.472828:2083-1355(-)
MILTGVFFAESIKINCPQDSPRVLTGMQCDNKCRGFKLACTNSKIPGLRVSLSGYTTSHEHSTSVLTCSKDTLVTSVETINTGSFRITCSRLERNDNSNIVPQVLYNECIMWSLSKDNQMVSCPIGTAVNSISTSSGRLLSFQCCKISAPPTVGLSPSVSDVAPAPMNAIVPTVPIWNGAPVDQAPAITGAATDPMSSLNIQSSPNIPQFTPGTQMNPAPCPACNTQIYNNQMPGFPAAPAG